MIRNLLSFMTLDNSSLWESANRLMVMSDEEYIELAYMLRKIIRECDYDTITGDISLKGFSIINSYDCEVFVPLSKLISKEPFRNKYDAKAKVEEGNK